MTGAGGYLGPHVVAALVRHGHDVRAAVRGVPPSGGQLLPEGRGVPGAAETYVLDVEDAATLVEPILGVEAVVHLAALRREGRGDSFHGTNVQGIRNLVRAMARVGARRLLHFSPLFTSDEARLGYAYSRWQGERLVRESGLAWTILRPALVFGPGHGPLDRIVRTVDASPPGTAVVPAGGRARHQPVHADDVAEAAARALEDEATYGRAIALGGPERLPYREVLARVLRALGENRRLVPVPLALLSPLAALAARRSPDPWLLSEDFPLFTRDALADPDELRRTFGIEPRPMTVAELSYLGRQRQEALARRQRAAERLRLADVETGPFAR